MSTRVTVVKDSQGDLVQWVTLDSRLANEQEMTSLDIITGISHHSSMGICSYSGYSSDMHKRVGTKYNKKRQAFKEEHHPQ